MRRLAFIIPILIAATAVAGSKRSLEFSQPASGINEVVIETGVGEIEVIGDSGSTITANVEIEADIKGWWGSSRTDLRDYEIEGYVNGHSLRLRLTPRNRHSKGFSENWQVRLPSAMAVTLEHGVGEVTVENVMGDLELEVGVGEVNVDGSFKDFSTITAECGVGEVTIRTPEGREDGEGFIGHEARVKGPGRSVLSVETGVGDVVIRLR